MFDITDERAMLIALLLDMPLGPPQPVEEIAEPSIGEKLASLSCCCAEMKAEAIWAQSLADRQCALQRMIKSVTKENNTNA